MEDPHMQSGALIMGADHPYSLGSHLDLVIATRCVGHGKPVWLVEITDLVQLLEFTAAPGEQPKAYTDTRMG
jgi:hypothetical protein